MGFCCARPDKGPIIWPNPIITLEFHYPLIRLIYLSTNKSIHTLSVGMSRTDFLLLLIPHLLRAGQAETLILPLPIITQPQHNGMFTISQRLGLIQNDGYRR